MSRTRALSACFQAEFLKICAFRFPVYATAGLVLFIALIAFNLLSAEDLRSHVQVTSAMTLLPYLAWASLGKVIVVPVFLIAFATYCTVVDSQYGMIRSACSQPLTRFEYAAAKSTAIITHAALCMLAYTALLLAASALAGGHWTITLKDATLVLVFSFRLLIQGIGITLLVIAAAMMRRTLLTGLVTAILFLIGFAWLNVLPMRYGLRPYLLFRYFLYPLLPILPSDLRFVDIPNADAAVWQFLVAGLLVPAMFWTASVTYFSKRDITE